MARHPEVLSALRSAACAVLAAQRTLVAAGLDEVEVARYLDGAIGSIELVERRVAVECGEWVHDRERRVRIRSA